MAIVRGAKMSLGFGELGTGGGRKPTILDGLPSARWSTRFEVGRKVSCLDFSIMEPQEIRSTAIRTQGSDDSAHLGNNL